MTTHLPQPTYRVGSCALADDPQPGDACDVFLCVLSEAAEGLMVDPATGLPALLGVRLRGVTGANAAAPLPHIGHARSDRLALSAREASRHLAELAAPRVGGWKFAAMLLDAAERHMDHPMLGSSGEAPLLLPRAQPWRRLPSARPPLS